MSYLDQLGHLAPECVLTLAAVVVLVWDLLKKGRNSDQCAYITLAGLGVTTLFLLQQWRMLSAGDGALADPVFGMVTIDLFGTFFKLFTVGSLSVVTLFVMLDKNERKHDIGEYYFLLLGGAIGIFFMVSTNNLMLLMLGLELLSLASYALAGFHKGERKSGEAALKYVIFGGLSAGVMLYGISLLFGLTGTLDLVEMGLGGPNSVSLATQFAVSPVPVAIAVVLVLAGFAYKVSVVPFHFWTPDVYQGAPTPVTTFLAVASKAAGFAVLLRFVGALFMTEGVADSVRAYGDRVGLLFAILAAVTMTLGNLSALRQSNLKRMLAYSSIAHAGYLLMGLATMTSAGFSASVFYLAAYYFMNLGAFGFLLYFESATKATEVEDLAGLGWKYPVVSMAMVVFMVSLTGLPPTVGFFGKFLLFKECIGADLMWLTVVAGLNSAVSLFYYFRVIQQLILKDPSTKAPNKQPFLGGIIVALAAMTVVTGIWVSLLTGWTDVTPKSLNLIEPPALEVGK